MAIPVPSRTWRELFLARAVGQGQEDMLSLDWEGSGKLSQRNSLGLALKEEEDVFGQRLEG